MISSFIIIAMFAPLTILGLPSLNPGSENSSTMEQRSTGYPKPPSLPDETDGVMLAGGIVINFPTWKAPSGTPIPAKSPKYDYSGPCTAYITQNGFGANVEYQAWFRDASNAPMGGMPTTVIGKTASFPVGGGTWTIGAIPSSSGFDVPAEVMMTWQSWRGWHLPMVAFSFNPAMAGSSVSGCQFDGNHGNGGVVTYFSCSFACGPSGQPQ